MEKTGIIPFTLFAANSKPSGSTYLRAESMVEQAGDFEMWKHGGKYDNLIFQKVYWPEMLSAFQGPKILDLCDPSWIRELVDIVELGESVHAITCSSDTLTNLVKNYFPNKIVEHVPDRLNLNYYKYPSKVHTKTATEVTWFGFSHNAYQCLPQLAESIVKNNLRLTIIANEPYEQEDEIKALKPCVIKYDQRTVNDHLLKADIILNPRSDKAFFKYKSNNKTIISWKLGIPVAETAEDLDLLMNPEERNKQVKDKQELIEREYDIRQSAQQYRDILKKIKVTFY